MLSLAVVVTKLISYFFSNKLLIELHKIQLVIVQRK